MERSSTAIKVFVGNLSFFSGRDELEKLFSPCGTIENIHLCKSETGDTMHFAFITFTNQDEASNAINTLNNTLFMGRNICVRTADRTIAKQFASTRKLEGWEVMFSFISHQKDILVCEESLRGIFMKFGEVLDCVIRSYNKGDNATQASRGLQNGYGFVEFRDRDTAEYVVSNIKSGSFLPLSPSTKVGPHSEDDDCDSGPFTVNLDCSFSRRSVSRLEELKNQDSNKSPPLSHTVKSKSHHPEASVQQVQVPLDSTNIANQGKSSIQLPQVFNAMPHAVTHSVSSLPAMPVHVQATHSFPSNNQSISYGPNSGIVITPPSYSMPFMQHNVSLLQSSQPQIQMSQYALSTQPPLFYSQTNAAVSPSDISHSNACMNHLYSAGQGNNSNFVNNNAANNMNNPTTATQDTIGVPIYVFPPQQPSVVVPLSAGQSLADNTTRSDGSASFVSDGVSCSNVTPQISPHPPIYYPPQVSTGYYSPQYFYTQQPSTQFMPQQHQQQQQHPPVQHVNVPTTQQPMTMMVQPHASGNPQYYSVPVDYHQQPFLNVSHQQHHHFTPQHAQQHHQLSSSPLQPPSQQQSVSPQHNGEFFRRSSSSNPSPRSSRSQSHSLSQHGTFFRG